HNPKVIRYEKGRDSPVSFFEDSYDIDALTAKFIEPILKGSKEVIGSTFDCRSDEVCIVNLDVSGIDVVLFEGLFLHRDELARYLDVSVYLKTEFSVSVPRGNARFGLSPNPDHTSNFRYVEGNRIYQKNCNPLARAGIVVDNDNLNNASIISNRYGYG
ncbi:MAG: hypothetical protein MJK13_08120, partial [Pseudomonadales bacterium]|nr:hypothetical protein [Pseudomonadales bacterium]